MTDSDSYISTDETIYSDSDMSSDESVHTSDENFIDDSTTEDEDEYVPEYKKQKTEIEQKVEIKFVNGKWVLNVKNVPISNNQ